MSVTSKAPLAGNESSFANGPKAVPLGVLLGPLGGADVAGETSGVAVLRPCGVGVDSGSGVTEPGGPAEADVNGLDGAVGPVDGSSLAPGVGVLRTGAGDPQATANRARRAMGTRRISPSRVPPSGGEAFSATSTNDARLR